MRMSRANSVRKASNRNKTLSTDRQTDKRKIDCQCKRRGQSKQDEDIISITDNGRKSNKENRTN